MQNKKGMKKSLVVSLLLLSVITVSIGYALLSGQVNINGNSNIDQQTWDVHFTNVDDQSTGLGLSGSATLNTDGQATISQSNNKLVTFDVAFVKPNDSYTFTVDVKNFGTIPAKVTNITPTIADSTARNYIDFTVTGLAVDDVLAPTGQTGDSKTVTVTAKFKNVTELPASAISTALTFQADFEQN